MPKSIEELLEELKVLPESNLEILVNDEDKKIIQEYNKNVKYFIRTDTFNGTKYIILPVPFLSNNDVEVGFAVDVDIDHFFVYAYALNYESGELKVLDKLPHCIHKAITFEGNNYQDISYKEIELVNFESASLFITNYMIRLSTSPTGFFEVFDDNLFLQLINRLISIPKISDTVIHLKLDEILKIYESLDKDSEFYENNLLRANVHLKNFLFGCEDNIRNRGFINRLSKEDILKIKPFIHDFYDYIFKEGYIFNARKISEWIGIKPDWEKFDMQEIYESLLKSERLLDAKQLYEWSGIKYQSPRNRNLVKKYFDHLLKNGSVQSAKYLFDLTGVEPDWTNVQEYYTKLFNDLYLDRAKELYKWSKIEPDWTNVQEYYKKFSEYVLFKQVSEIEEWSNIKSKVDKEFIEKILQQYKEHLLNRF